MYVYENWIKDAYENSIKITDKGIIVNVHIIVDKEDDLFSAHCLEFDLVGEGSSIEEAEKSIVNNIVNYITFAISKGLFNKIINPAPPEYRNKLIHSKFLKPIPIHPDKKVLREKNLFPFLNDLSGEVISYQAYHA